MGIRWVVVESDVIDPDVAQPWSDDPFAACHCLRLVAVGLPDQDRVVDLNGFGGKL